jgi:hypothetical protein
VFSYEARTVLGRWAFDLREEVLPAHAEVFARYRDALVVNVHHLGDRAPWVSELVESASTHRHLQAVHRSSYLSWHCLGRQVLKLRRAAGGVEIVGGVDFSGESIVFARNWKQTITGPLNADQVREIFEAVDAAVERRLDGTDSGHPEHLLQALLADDMSVLGLVTDRPGMARREFPAKRADDKRGYLDFLGTDKYGRLHVVETKIGNDAMLVLQGLDYWIWANAHRKSLAKVFGLSGTPEVVVDFVVATSGTKPAVGPYTAVQAEALPGSLRWRCHLATGLETRELKVTRLERLAWPEGTPSFAAKHHAFALLDHLSTEQHLPGPIVGGALLASASVGIVPAARWALEELEARGVLHRYAHHIRSSQAFALNMFGPLDRSDTLALLRTWFPDVAEADPPIFEWSDPNDRLAELTPQHPHRSQVDVVLRGRRNDGASVAALIEVKLTETDFGTCSAYQADANDTREICRTDGPFGVQP